MNHSSAPWHLGQSYYSGPDHSIYSGTRLVTVVYAHG
jgi:hypothetical protein